MANATAGIACRGNREMNEAEIGKIGRWDDHYLKKALKQLDGKENKLAHDVIKKVLHHDPKQRIKTMREVLNHAFFIEKADMKKEGRKKQSTKSYLSKIRNRPQLVK